MESEDWQKEFSSFTDALRYAASVIHKETPVTMFNEFGVAFLERVVLPIGQ